jgi:hypothetical protein
VYHANLDCQGLVESPDKWPVRPCSGACRYAQRVLSSSSRRMAILLALLALTACDDGQAQHQHDERWPAEADLIEELSAIGYVAGGEPAGPRSGVGVHEVDRAEAGLNLFTSGHGPVALLMDMEGKLLHEWRISFEELFPDHPHAASGDPPKRNFWRVARLLPRGELVVIWELYGIFKLDRDSRVLWVVPGTAHHDLHITPDGNIHHLEAERRWMPEIEGRRSIDDMIVTRDANGAELRRLRISDAMRGAAWPDLRKVFWLRNIARGYELGERAGFDPFHTNAVHILSNQEARVMGAPFAGGQALVSLAMLDTIAVIDLEEGAARWWQQGPFGMQHQPRVTPDGRIVVFNNHRDQKRSSVQVLDPATRRITWQYHGPEADPLFSLRSGGAQILPNGNFLIVETDRGRVLEVTPNEQLVWEFRSPFRVGEDGDRIAAIYALDRVPESLWLTPGAGGEK